MTAQTPIEKACYWLATAAPSAAEPLVSDHETDYVIVGAGLTGLWAALTLTQLAPNVGVTVVEQGVAAYGGSGRNAGILAENVDHSHSLAIQHFGEPEARRLAELGTQNVHGLYRDLAAWGIDCDLERTGQLVVALTPAHLDDCAHTVEVAARLGLTTLRYLDRDALRAQLDSPLYLGGVQIQSGGILNPVKLVNGLVREARRRGVRIHERSRVRAVQTTAAGAQVQTEDGSVRARKVLLATSAYTHHLLPGIRSRFIPLYDYILVSEPLTPAQLESLGWRGRQGVTDCRTFFNYYRLTADGRVLWGTSEAAYYAGNRVDAACDHSPGHYEALKASWQRHFPQLAALRWEYQWGGAICSTTRMTPFFGAAHGGRVLYGLGYTGHGLGNTRLGGQILAHLALDQPSELLQLQLVTRKPFPYPPEPLRSLVVSMVTKGLRQVDAGGAPTPFLRLLDKLGLGFSS